MASRVGQYGASGAGGDCRQFLELVCGSPTCGVNPTRPLQVLQHALKLNRGERLRHRPWECEICALGFTAQHIVSRFWNTV